MKLRHAVLVALGLTVFLVFPGMAAASPKEGLLRFEVALDGSPIGEHSLNFAQTDAKDLEIGIAIDLAVKLGPFTVFDYTHRNASLWRDGLLYRMQSETDDNGDLHKVLVEAGDGTLRVTAGGVNVYEIPDRMLPTTYWMASTVAQSQLINSQTGELLEVEILERGREDVPGPNGPIPATHYELTGDLEIDLWYDDAGILVGLAFVARGSDVTYRLIERVGLLPVAAAMPNLTARN